MTLHVGPLPAGDERHLKALEAAQRHAAYEAEHVLAAYHRSLADQGVRLVDASEVAEKQAKAIAAWVRAEAESKDYATYCVWHNVADAIEAEAEDKGWRCADCRCVNGDHEAFCFRCGAGQPEAER